MWLGIVFLIAPEKMLFSLKFTYVWPKLNCAEMAVHFEINRGPLKDWGCSIDNVWAE